MKPAVKKILDYLKKNKAKTSLLIHTNSLQNQIEIAKTISKQLLTKFQVTDIQNNPDCYGIWPDIDYNKSIGIKEAHDFKNKSQLKPFYEDVKVGVIISSEKLTIEAQNSLLKTIEEPPSNTILLLTTSDLDKLIGTIRSRCRIYNAVIDSTNTRLANIEELIGQDLVKRLQYVEKLISEKDKALRTQKIDELLSQFLNYKRSQLLKENLKDSEVDKITNDIELIESVIESIERNVNLRLALETLFTNIT